MPCTIQQYLNWVKSVTYICSVSVNSADLKKLSTLLSNLHIEKLKIEKGDKSKKNKGKGKAKLKLEGETVSVFVIYGGFNILES